MNNFTRYKLLKLKDNDLNNQYLNVKYNIEKIETLLKQKYNKFDDLSNCFIDYDIKNNKLLSICFYNQKLFIGIYDKKTKNISFDEEFLQISENSIDKLISRYSNFYKQHYVKNEIDKAWERTLPLLQCFCLYDNFYNSLSKEERIYYGYNNQKLMYETDINMLVNTFYKERNNFTSIEEYINLLGKYSDLLNSLLLNELKNNMQHQLEESNNLIKEDENFERN